ncbi:hypothetical protein Tco_0697660 [Tanacetum coccineum]
MAANLIDSSWPFTIDVTTILMKWKLIKNAPITIAVTIAVIATLSPRTYLISEAQISHEIETDKKCIMAAAESQYDYRPS